MQYILEQGGTSDGIHQYSELIECARRYQLNLESKGDGTWIQPEYFDVGKFGHVLMELYYRHGHVEIEDLEFVDRHDELVNYNLQAFGEAERCFSAYRDQYPSDEFGKPVEIERRFPANDYEQQIIMDMTGGVPYSGQWDLVLHLNETDCARLGLTRNIDVFPGWWVTDHKFLRTANTPIDQFIYDPQLPGYMMAWDVLHPDKLCSGALVNIVGKTKTPNFKTYVIDRPDAVGEKVFLKFIEHAHRVKGDPILGNWANSKACFSYWRVCDHYLSGKCPRY